jgi:putative ABC transport system ATP-binding protein
VDRRAPVGAVGASAGADRALPAVSEPDRQLRRRGSRSLSLFELQDVSYSRGGNRVLAGIDAVIESGATALVGPSGSGKSTLLRLLNRLADPESGVVRMHGDDVRELDVLDLRRRAVLVPQLPAPLPGTVADNVRYGPSLIGREADVVRWLELSGLDAGYAEREAARLSVGEQQRVMFARALALGPEVLLLDEPTSALDETARDEIERTLRDIEERVSIVLVTHDRAQAERLAPNTIRIRDGRVEE